MIQRMKLWLNFCHFDATSRPISRVRRVQSEFSLHLLMIQTFHEKPDRKKPGIIKECKNGKT